MDERQADCAKVRALLRDYVLEQRTDLDAHFAACPACREALEKMRASLAPLEALPPVEPPPGLAERTLKRIAETEEKRTQPDLRWTVVMATVCMVVIVAAVLLPSFGRARQSAEIASVVGNLKQLGLVFRMYAGQSKGAKYPPPAPYDGVHVFDLRAIYPEFLNDPDVLVNPDSDNYQELRGALDEALAKKTPDWERADRIVAQSYVYTGYPLKDESELEVFQEARDRRNADELRADGKVLYQLREGIERFYITDINNPAASALMQSDIPILVENPASRDDGVYVLYMDGHVEFVPKGEKFPATKAFQKAFPPPPLDK